MRTNGESGFSMLEVTLCALLTVGLMGVIFAVSNRNQQVFVTEMGVVDMNQNVRTVIDLMTRDIQVAGVGLPSGTKNMVPFFYTNGANGAPDTIMMINGDPFAPVATLDERAAGSSEFFLLPPHGLTTTGSGSNQIFTYVGEENKNYKLYRDSKIDDKQYIVYDEEHAMIFDLTGDGQTVGNGPTERIKLEHNPTSYSNPPSVFGTLLDTEEPDYGNSNVALLGSMIGYRLNQQTNELERTENLEDWFPVARGIVNLQIEYRVARRTAAGAVEEKVTETPGAVGDLLPSNTPTSRKQIRSIVITVEAETPDVDPGERTYRRVVHKFEVTPRNLNLVNRNNTTIE